MGWENSWESCMNDKVGTIMIITNIDDDSGVYLNDGYGYPYFVLKKEEPMYMPDNTKVGDIVILHDQHYIITDIKNGNYFCRVRFNDSLEHYNISL